MIPTMQSYRITDSVTGKVLGVYRARIAGDAINAMIWTTGWIGARSWLEIVPVTEPTGGAGTLNHLVAS